MYRATGQTLCKGIPNSEKQMDCSIGKYKSDKKKNQKKKSAVAIESPYLGTWDTARVAAPSWERGLVGSRGKASSFASQWLVLTGITALYHAG